MDLLEQLEHPIPIIKVESEKIVIETSENIKGRFLVTNTGGGKLEGKITSKNPYLHFAQKIFFGNSVWIEYETNIAGFKPGDLIRTNAVIMSNGGEKTVSFIIKVISTVVETTSGHNIADLKDFISFARKNPTEAGNIFISKTFRAWLSAIGYEYLDIFDFIVQDSNKERAIENFFVLNKQKNRPSLSISDKLFAHEVSPQDKGIITGVFYVKKIGWGYVECPVIVTSPVPWLSIKPGFILPGMFNQDDLAEVNYFIDPGKIESKVEKAIIKFANFGEVELRVRKKPLFECRSKKESYLFEDTGALIITNNSGSDVLFEIATNENYVKFEGRKYLVGSYAEIPFKIKLAGIQSAQLTLKRQPIAFAEIYIRSEYNKSNFRKTVRIALGDL